MNNRYFKGFTLAEVLITLGVIGVVAAMTMPSLIQKQNEKATVVKLKKFNSVMNQAMKMAIMKNGEISDWDLHESELKLNEEGTNQDEVDASIATIDKIADIFSKELSIASKNKYADVYNSENQIIERYSLDGTFKESFPWSKKPLIALADGSFIRLIYIYAEKCNGVRGTSESLKHVCGEFFYDVNGNKGPNVTGRDIFVFLITKYGIIPQGTAEQIYGHIFDSYCNLENKSDLNGYGCTAWVIYNENMDYLHCNDLSWDGKHKCK